MAINPVSSHQPIGSPAAPESKHEPSPGEKPFSRSTRDPGQALPVHPRYIGGADFYDAPGRETPATSAPSPHIPGHHASGQTRVHLDPAGNPTHLAGVGSNGQPVVLHKVSREASDGDSTAPVNANANADAAAAAADESGKPKRASSPGPHVAGGEGPEGKQDVNLDPKGYPTHLVISGAHGVGVARKV